MTARLFIFLILLLFPSTGAMSVEIYRNSISYKLNVILPDGVNFKADGIDRRFFFDGIDGNLRLIQDKYNGCLPLVEERKRNWEKKGYRVTSFEPGSKDCSIGMVSDGEGRRISSFYVWIQKCGCYAALHFSYSSNNRDAFLANYQPILNSLRSNDASRGGASDFAANTTACMTNDRFNCEYLSCDEQRRRGHFAEDNEYDHCNLPRRDKPSSTAAAGAPNGDAQNTRQREKEAAERASRQAREQQERERRRVTFEVQNNDGYDLHIEFASQTRKGRYWPGGDKVWRLPAHETRSFTLACNPGEKICYGAWRIVEQSRHWGGGYDVAEACSSCCFTCGSGTHEKILNAGPPAVISRNNRSNTDAIEAAGAIIGLGAAILGGMNTGRTYSPPPRTYNTRPAPGQSDISGTR